MFLEKSGEVYRVVLREESGSWLISYENPLSPCFVLEQELKTFQPVEPPKDYQQYVEEQKNPTAGQQKRKALISELLADETLVADRSKRNEKIKEIADREHTTIRRIQKLYFRYLAGRPLVEKRETVEKAETEEEKIFSWAVDTFYYSAKKMSLRTVYDCMLLSRYTDQQGRLMPEHPTWHMFRHYFYRKNCHRTSRNTISRNGLTNYQRNKRPLFGSASQWKGQIGAFQMDATQADIYLVSRLDRSEIIGRPNLYLAVDTASQLIAGIYVGLDAGEQAVISCLSNAAMDKVEFCRQYGIEIQKEDWPNTGLPGEIITDKGREFLGNRMNELAMRYGIEFESLPPFRPDGKGLVEKMFDLIQQKYKPLLRGKGVIEEDAQERWAVDYRSQAVLTLEDFTKIVIHCVLYLNSSRILQNCQTTESLPVASALWNWQEEQGNSIVIPIDSERLYLFGLPRKTVTLSRKGINHQGLWYVSRTYKKLLEKQKIGGAVQIAYDPENVSQVYLLEGMEYLPFELASYCKAYAGVTETEYQMEREKTKVNRQELERLDTKGRIRVLQSIQEIVNEAEFVEKEKVDTQRIQKNRRRERA